MYVPKHHEETDLSVLHALIRAHPLGAWVTLADGELLANHVPFLLDAGRGPYGTLVGHVARANPVWRAFSTQVDSVIVFQGAQAYITPSWYPSKHAHGQAVPTWNYAVVHARGRPRAIEDRDWLLQHVSGLTDYTQRLLGAIVGIEIPISQLVGKWKVSQHRPMPDRLGVVAGLMARDDAQSAEMAALMNRTIPTARG
jgi:transcriptional regulator